MWSIGEVTKCRVVGVTKCGVTGVTKCGVVWVTVWSNGGHKMW